jgi:PAS domain S-box-containing protein
MKVSDFDDFYRSVALPEGSSVALFRDDGTLLVRYPSDPEMLGRSFASAQSSEQDLVPGQSQIFHITGEYHTTKLIFAAERLLDYPVVAHVGTTEEAVLRIWRRQSLVVGVAGTFGSIAVGFIAWLLLRQLAAYELVAQARARAEHDTRVREQLELSMAQAKASAREQERAEAALRQSEQRFRDIAEVASDWIWETGPDHRYTFFTGNRLGELAKVGVGAANILGMTRWELADAEPASDDHWRSHLQDLEARRPFRNFCYSAKSPTGAVFHISVSGKPMFESAGTFLGYRGIATNETETVEAARRQRDLEQQLQRLADQARADAERADASAKHLAYAQRIAGVGSSLRDLRSGHVEWTDEVYRILGLDPKLPPSFELFRSVVHPDDLAKIDQAAANARSGLSDPPFEYRIIRPNGEVGIIHRQSEVFEDLSGNSRSRITTMMDITALKAAEAELRESQERLNRAQRLAGLGIAEHDLRRNKTVWTDENYRIYGVDRSFVPSPDSYLKLAHPEDRERLLRMMKDLDSGTAFPPFEYRIIRPDGETRYLYREHEMIKDEAGKPARILSTVKDITEIRASQQRQRELEQQLVRSQKMEAIGSLTGGIAHDFNNLLGVIIGNLDLLNGRPYDVDDKEMLSEALTAAFRGAELTSRLLSFARRQPLQSESTDVNELVSNTVALLRRTLGENIEIVLELTPDLWPAVVDPAQLEAAVTNLATNSRDAMPKGGKLTLRTTNVNLDDAYVEAHDEVQPGAYISLEVRDTGSGIPLEIQTKIFDPFFTTKDVGKGSGLGLSMVFGFVKQSGGHVSVDSEVGRGACFHLFLPRAQRKDALEETALGLIERDQGGHERILVVEDNEQMRRVVLRQLSSLGYDVIEAENAASALDILRRDKVDLLFTDVVMPGGMSGPDLAHDAATLAPGLKVLFTSGFPSGRDDVDSWLQGDAKLLGKPYRKDELARALRETLDA